MDLFAHRIHSAAYINGCVRLECSIVHPDENGEYHPNEPVKPGETTFSVNLPLQGFMRSVGVIRDLVKKLQDDGTLKGREGGGAEGRPGAERARPGRNQQLTDLSEENRSDDDNIV